MAIFKCKMCGGDLEINEGVTVCDCDYCGTKQTVPTSKDENLHGLYNRANTLRIKAEFDKAEQLYEKILQADESQAEAYWGLILCKYGIEYVEDPATFKRMPTCHRASFDSIIADEDYKSALKYADALQKSIYEQEAKEIDRIQKEIIELSSKEEPYDVFICYKETDETGSRTQDSVIANDIYYQLTQEGFKVFYAAITLEDKLGSAYEPCIFAALNSAKVMLSIGTKPEYFNAVWVKNEWSRYLKIMKKDRSRLLIPCYKDMDAYELPDEFAHLQAQDMGKIGFINDVVRGISKVINKDEPVVATKTVETANPTVAPLVERVFLFLEDGDWKSAADYCEKVLDLDPKNAYAYMGKLMSDLKVKIRSELANLLEPFSDNGNYIKLIRFADDKLKAEIEEYANKVQEVFNEAKNHELYAKAKSTRGNAKTKEGFFAAAEKFRALGDYRDAKELYDDCILRGNNIEKEAIYTKAKGIIDSATTESEIDKAIQMLSSILDYLDAKELADKCMEEWKRNFERYTVLVSNYKVLSQKTNGASREQQIKNEINKLSSEKNQFARLVVSFPNDRCELDSTESQIKSKKEMISALQTERASLGLFAGKRKKEIDGNVYALQKDVDALNLKASQLKNALCGYSSVDEINSKINSTDSQITKLQSELVEVEAEANSTQLGSLDDVINELLSADIFKFVLRNSTVLSELLKNSAVLKSVMNDTSLVSKLYGVKLPQNIIDQLEGTDDKLYFVHKKDCRTEAQIVADFEKYFASAFFADYEIARDVDPTYFGAHPKCKPIQFLFKKNGKDVLAVAILKYSSLTHPAVKNVKESCKNRRIPYLQFIVGYPNKEHYVVRRALEELGEIDYLYADYYWQRWPMKQLENLAKEIDNKEVWERVEFRKKHRINL